MNAIMHDTFPWRPVCSVKDLVSGCGVAALIDQRQLAIFYLPWEQPKIYAIDNWDPLGRANVLSRGILGDIKGELVVASPLYKQHFSLATGRCLEHECASVNTYPVRIVDGRVEVMMG